MQIHKGLSSFLKPIKGIVTSGTFDGVHIGHQKILRRLQEIARAEGGETVVITFWPHPRTVLFPDEQDLRLLSSLDEKAYLLEQQGVDHLLVLPFNKEFAQTTSQEFIQHILIEKIGTHKLVIGYDHRFGKNREGGFEYLKEHASELGFGVEEIPRQDIDDVGVSSSKIRKALQLGDVETANLYLGSPYLLSGTVVEGQKLGRTIGYPTANVVPQEPRKLIPADGTYAITARVQDKWHEGMLYIGPRPTLGNALARTIEANLFDFDGNIYGESIQLHLQARLRGDEKFEGLGALKAQLGRDKEQAIQLLKKNSK